MSLSQHTLSEQKSVITSIAVAERFLSLHTIGLSANVIIEASDYPDDIVILNLDTNTEVRTPLVSSHEGKKKIVHLPDGKFAVAHGSQLSIFSNATFEKIKSITLVPSGKEDKKFVLPGKEDKKNAPIDVNQLNISFSGNLLLVDLEGCFHGCESASSRFVFVVDVNTSKFIYIPIYHNITHYSVFINDSRIAIASSRLANAHVVFYDLDMTAGTYQKCCEKNIEYDAELSAVWVSPGMSSRWVMAFCDKNDRHQFFLYEEDKCEFKQIKEIGTAWSVELGVIQMGDSLFFDIANGDNLTEFNFIRSESTTLEVPGIMNPYPISVFPDGELGLCGKDLKDKNVIVKLKLKSVTDHAQELKDMAIAKLQDAIQPTAGNMARPVLSIIADYGFDPLFFPRKKEPTILSKDVKSLSKTI